MAGHNGTIARLNLLMSHKVKPCILAISILFAPRALAQNNVKRIGEIEFFGAAGIDVAKVRAALPFHEGDEFTIERAEEKRKQALEAVKQVTGQPPTDIGLICCDDQVNWIIFIGLSGKTLSFNAQPQGATRLPKDILDLYQRSMNALGEAVQKGAAAEDHSNGYAVSEYPPLRSTELEMRAYAVDHEALLRDVLQTSSDNEQRVVAAKLLGYARQSKSQLTALTRASRDSDGTVRNNATRALVVLVDSNPNLAGDIPAEDFIERLLSGKWTDLNKASSLLYAITKGRNPKLLAGLRKSEVQESLIEMARWRTNHAQAARYILGRMGGIDEDRLQQLVAAGNVEAILGSLPKDK